MLHNILGQFWKWRDFFPAPRYLLSHIKLKQIMWDTPIFKIPFVQDQTFLVVMKILISFATAETSDFSMINEKFSFPFVCIFWGLKDDATEAHSPLKEENT